MNKNNQTYETAGALEQAFKDRAKPIAAETGISYNEAERRFLFDRLLVRIFTEDSGEWFLKGGTALLARIPDARSTKDLDLANTQGPIDEVVQRLKALAQKPLNDFLLFIPEGRDEAIGEGDNSPVEEGRRIKFQTFWGTKKKSIISVDVVVTPETTSPIQALENPYTRVHMPGLDLSDSLYRVYGINDHVADKVCAIMEMRAGHRSSRAKDLVDLAVVSTHQGFQFDSVQLHQALATEMQRRSLDFEVLDVPEDWTRQYAKLVRKTPACKNISFQEACQLASRLVDPTIRTGYPKAWWNPDSMAWEATG